MLSNFHITILKGFKKLQLLDIIEYINEKYAVDFATQRKVDPVGALSLVLRELSEQLDYYKYSTPIKDYTGDIFCISSLTGLIVKVPKERIKNYKSFAFFRNIDDAKMALRECKSLIDAVFNGE